MLRKTQKHLTLFYVVMSELLSRLAALYSRQLDMKNLTNKLLYRKAERLRREAQTERFIERVLSVIAVLGLIFIGLGIVLCVGGRVPENFVFRVGVYMLLIGIALIAMRVFFWLLEGIVRRGLESMLSQK